MGRPTFTYEEKLQHSRTMARLWCDPLYTKKVIDYRTGRYCGRLSLFQELHVRNLYGRSCVLCGMGEVFNGQQLSLHHITGNDSQHGDGQPWLLSLLCEECHVEIHKEEGLDRHLHTLLLLKAFELCFEGTPWIRRNDGSLMFGDSAYYNEPLL